MNPHSGRNTLAIGSPRPKIQTALVHFLVNPKEAAHIELSKLTDDIELVCLFVFLFFKEEEVYKHNNTHRKIS